MKRFVPCNSLVVKALDSQTRGPAFKTTGCFQGQLSTFHPPGLSNRVSGISGNTVVNSELPPHRRSVALRQLNPIHIKGQIFFICKCSQFIF